MTTKYPTTSMCDGAFLETFEPLARDTDVFITTTAKCGQTWLQALLYHLKTRGLSPDYEGIGLLGVTPWLELPWDSRLQKKTSGREERLADIEKLSDPRIFKLHVIWDEVPRPATSKARVITITRDPREVPYSLFCHMQALEFPDGKGPTTDFDLFFDGWLERGLYFQLVKSYWEHKDDPDFLWLRYEDMKADLHGHAKRLVEFLGWDLTPSDIERALPLVQLAHMQKAERKEILPGKNGVWKEGKRFFREGAVGKNRAHLSEEQEARILETARRELGEECYDFVVSLPDGDPD